MNIKRNYSLRKHNTFGIDVKTKLFCKINSVKQLINVLVKYPNEKILILGDGSNTLLVNDWDGLVLKMRIKGKRKIKETNEKIYIKVGAGENWDKFVRYTVRNNWGGIENMVMVPGTIGGATRENIACYGQNISERIDRVTVMDIKTHEIKELSSEECDYSYRDSRFKNDWKTKYIIISTTFELKKENKDLELSYHERAGRYGSIKEELESFAKEPYSIKDVMRAVIRQRTKRLPSVKKFGTCGSFFKNPIIKFKEYKELQNKIEDLQCYPVENLKYDLSDTKDFKDEDLVKVPAGRLLDELKWKGKWDKDVGVSANHALCVVTNKKATGREIYDFSKRMQEDVKEKYGITLIPEVNIIE